MAPYTEEDEATTTWAPPAWRAASSTRSVPVAFTSWVATGSSSERGTEARAARCTTASAPPTARRSAWSSRIEPSMSSTPSTPSMLSARPVERSSRTTTRSTAGEADRARHRLAPMKPAPPVTTIRRGPDDRGPGDPAPGTAPRCAILSEKLDVGPGDAVAGVEDEGRVLAHEVVVEAVVIGHDDHGVGRRQGLRRERPPARRGRSPPAGGGRPR